MCVCGGPLHIKSLFDMWHIITGSL